MVINGGRSNATWVTGRKGGFTAAGKKAVLINVLLPCTSTKRSFTVQTLTL